MKSLKDINWNHLFIFYEVAREKSLKVTSTKLGLASSTLSEQIKRLEKGLCTQLFIRARQGFILTTDGRKLFEHARIIFETGGKLLDDFSTTGVGGYPVNVGIVETLSQNIAVEFTAAYWDLFTPYGTVNTLRSPEHQVLMEDLVTGNLDWGISLSASKRRSIESREIGTYSICFYVSEDIFNHFKRPSDILEYIPLALTNWDHTLNDQITLYLRKKRIWPKEIFYSDHPQYIKNLCLRGRCLVAAVNNSQPAPLGLKKIELGDPIQVKIFAHWRKVDQNLISIQKLKDLIRMRPKKMPQSYDDIKFQLDLSSISGNLLR